MIKNFLDRFEYLPGTSKSPVTAAAPASMPVVSDNDMHEWNDYEFDGFDIQEESDDYYCAQNEVPKLGYDLFSKPDRLDKRVVIINDNSALQLPKIFEDETKFSSAISDSLAKYETSACTKKLMFRNWWKGT